jgi:hypothetical protein
LQRQLSGGLWIVIMRIMMHAFPRRSVALAAAVSAIAAWFSPNFSVNAVERKATTAQAQLMQQRSAKSDKAGPKTPMERCIATWDRATQMSKQEWRETCKRTVKEYPDLFSKPY